jgi:hypothetical protein
MRKTTLFAAALGALLCAIGPRRPMLKTIGSPHVAGVANRAGVVVQLLALPPLANTVSGSDARQPERSHGSCGDLTEGPPIAEPQSRRRNSRRHVPRPESAAARPGGTPASIRRPRCFPCGPLARYCRSPTQRCEAAPTPLRSATL